MALGPLRRLLGSTSLERKCRLLFGACLLLLIFASFWWYGKATEKLVHQQSRNTGIQLVQSIMLKLHFEQFVTDKEMSVLAQRTIEALEDLDYSYEFLSLDEVNEDSFARVCTDADRPTPTEIA